MTYFVPAYDVEMGDTSSYKEPVPTCLQALQKIVEKHHQYNMPGTFFIVGKLLETAPQGFRDLLDDPLFEVASHSYSHKLLRDHSVCGVGVSADERQIEIVRGKELIENVFQRRCRGMRTPVGFSDALRGQKDLLGLISGAGMDYVSSQLWGPDTSLPAPLVDSFTYSEEGFPKLREFPSSGWHENLLKGSNRIFGQVAGRFTYFPPLYPESMPSNFVKTPEEEFKYNNQVFLTHGIAEKRAYVTLVWHPWSLGLFDPPMRMLEITFEYICSHGIPTSTFSQMYDRYRLGELM